MDKKRTLNERLATILEDYGGNPDALYAAARLGREHQRDIDVRTCLDEAKWQSDEGPWKAYLAMAGILSEQDTDKE
jgi:hypothetical protein